MFGKTLRPPTPEAQLMHDVRAASSTELDLVLFRNSTGAVRTGDSWQRFGLQVGSSDLVGLLGPAGRFLAIELKSKTGRLSDDQQMFLSLVRRLGGFGAVVRSVSEFRVAIERARAGECE